jgi:hypothetical protein
MLIAISNWRMGKSEKLKQRYFAVVILQSLIELDNQADDS